MTMKKIPINDLTIAVLKVTRDRYLARKINEEFERNMSGTYSSSKIAILRNRIVDYLYGRKKKLGIYRLQKYRLLFCYINRCMALQTHEGSYFKKKNIQYKYQSI